MIEKSKQHLEPTDEFRTLTRHCYRYKTISDAISDAEISQEKSKSNRLAGQVIGPVKFLGHDDFQQQILELEKLQELFHLSKEGSLLQNIQDSFQAAKNKMSFLKELNEMYYQSLNIRAVDADCKYRNSILRFYANLIDDPDFLIKQIARNMVLRSLQIAPREVRDFIFKTWAFSGISIDQIIEQFDKETPGKLARIEMPFYLEELKKLSISSYETSLVSIFDGYWLVRGDEKSVLIPGKPVFHSHPNCSVEEMWPSRGTLENPAGDFIYNLERGECGFIISPRGITLYSGDAWASDSLIPFERLFIEEVKSGAEYIGGILFFPRNYAIARIPMAFFSWSLLKRGRKQPIPLLSLTEGDANRTDESLLVEMRERVRLPTISFERQEGVLNHYNARYAHITGSYVLEVKK